MSESDLSRSASRSAFLELREEQRLVRSGYEFLDEKRIELAAEMLRQRAAYRDARAQLMSLSEKASAALIDAAAAEGLEAIQLHPAATLEAAHLKVAFRRFVGLSLVDADLDIGTFAMDDLPASLGVVRACADTFREVLAAGVRLAGITANLERLMYEYGRTERRVRALENVVLPEIRSEIATMEEHLELNEQEEVLRSRVRRS